MVRRCLFVTLACFALQLGWMHSGAQADDDLARAGRVERRHHRHHRTHRHHRRRRESKDDRLAPHAESHSEDEALQPARDSEPRDAPTEEVSPAPLPAVVPEQSYAEERADEESAPEVEATPVTEQVFPTRSVIVAADEHGFRIASRAEDPAFELELRALLQMDARVYVGSGAERDEFLLRRVRPRLSGTVFGLIDFKLVTDFGEGDVELTDALVDVHPLSWLRLMTGKFSPPLGLERLQSNATMPMVEGALDANLSVSRDVGLQLWGELFGEALLYQVAVMNGVPDGSKGDRDEGKHKDVVARLFLLPLAHHPRLGSLGFGFAVSHGKRDGSPDAPSLSRYKTVGQTTLFTYLASDTDPEETVFARGAHTRLNPHAYYFGHGLGVLAETVQSRQEVHRGTSVQSLAHRAWHATASYVFHGRNTYDGAKVISAWSPRAGQLGALEIVARYDALQLDAKTFPTYANAWESARAGRAMGATVNWILTPLFRVVVGYERMLFRGGAGARASVADRPVENSLIVRLTLSL